MVAFKLSLFIALSKIFTKEKLMTEVVLDRQKLPTAVPAPSTDVAPLEIGSSGAVEVWESEKRSGKVEMIPAACLSLITGFSGSILSMQLTADTAYANPALAVGAGIAYSVIRVRNTTTRMKNIRNVYKEAFGREISKNIQKGIYKLQKSVWMAEPVYLSRENLGIPDPGPAHGQAYAYGLLISNSDITIMWKKRDSLLTWDKALMDAMETYGLEASPSPKKNAIETAVKNRDKALDQLMNNEIDAKAYIEIVRESQRVISQYENACVCQNCS